MPSFRVSYCTLQCSSYINRLHSAASLLSNCRRSASEFIMAIAVSPLLSKFFCLSLLWLLFQVGLASPAASPTSRHTYNTLYSPKKALSKRAEPKFRTFSFEWTERVAKGVYLQSLFPLSDAEVGQANDGHPVASLWQDPKAAVRWGWTTGIKWAPFPKPDGPSDENVPSYRDSLNDAFKWRGHSVDQSELAIAISKHNQTFLLSDGSTGQVSTCSLWNYSILLEFNKLINNLLYSLQTLYTRTYSVLPLAQSSLITTKAPAL